MIQEDEYDYLAETLVNFETFVASRAKAMQSPILDMVHATMGISGEAGELLDAVKKSFIYNKPLDTENVIEELGDIMFYVQHMLNQFPKHSLYTVLNANMDKLRKRYPDGYSDAAAQARTDKLETGETK
jgi:NTP pyrophosphatase (non-canonical NTP hydrolase)